jgi:hypothetical protein
MKKLGYLLKTLDNINPKIIKRFKLSEETIEI